MLALVERPRPALLPKQAAASPAEIFTNVVWLAEGGPIHRPQRYEDLARKYGTVVWVYAAVHRKAVDTSAVPVRVVQRRQEQLVEAPRDHPLRRLLARINDFMTYMDLIESTSANLDLSGNAYWLKFATRGGRVAELWPIRPDLVTIIASPEEYIGGYQISAGRETFDFLPNQVLHFREFSPFSDYYGLGAVTPVWNSAIVEEEAQVWNRNYLRNAGRLDGLLTSEQIITPAQAEENAQRFRQILSGPRNIGRIAVLGKGLKYESIATSPKELDFVLSRKLTREEILAAIGVRPVILGLESGDIGRRSEQIRDYFYSTVGGRVAKIIGAVNEFLVPDFAEDGLEVMADIETALLPYEDRLALAQADASDVQNRIRTPNEIRRRRGLPPIEGGDTILIPISMIPVSSAGSVLGTPIAGQLHAGPPALKAADDPRGLLWDDFVARAAAQERPFEARVRQAFIAARDVVVPQLTAASSQNDHAVAEGMTTLRILLRQIGRDQLPGILEAGWHRAIGLVNAQRSGVPAVLPASPAFPILKAGEISIAFDLRIPRLADYLDQRPVVYADQVTGTVAPQIRQTLADLANQGAGVDQMASALTDKFDILAASRAALIARMEVIAASNLAATEAYRQSGVVAQQEWLSARDERVRATHAVADGQTRALDEPFDVGGAALRFPGDPSGPIGEIANCRCTVLPIVQAAE